MDSDKGYIDDLERSVRVLAYLVREEYPIKYSLADIAGLWGSTDVDDQDIAALRRVEQRLFPRQEEADS